MRNVKLNYYKNYLVVFKHKKEIKNHEIYKAY